MNSTQVSTRAARRALALLAVVAAGLACGDATGPLRSTDVAGTYARQSIRGHPLPWADTSSTDSTRSQIIWYSERLTLRADGTATDVDMLGYRNSPQARPDSGSYQWALNPAGQVDGADVVRLRYFITAPHDAPYADFFYRAEDGGRRLVAVGASPYPPDVYTR